MKLGLAMGAILTFTAYLAMNHILEAIMKGVN